MDGSADLRWRSSSEEEEEERRRRRKRKEETQLEHPPKFKGPRAKGRSLDAGWKQQQQQQQQQHPRPRSEQDIRYNFAFSKSDVFVPRYSFRGGPEVLSTILGTCWRLHYVRCPPLREDEEEEEEEEEGGRGGERQGRPLHPCCMLSTNPSPLTPPTNRLTRWMRNLKKMKMQGRLSQ